MKSLRSFATGLLLALLLAGGVCGQEARGGLSGIVQDGQGARVPNAQLLLEGGGAGARQVTANRNGDFSILELTPGVYQLMVTAPGFAPARSEVTVQVSVVRALVVTLRPAAVQSVVEVRSGGSSIATQPLDLSAVHEGVVTASDLATIPLAARSFANIAYLVPGTEPVEPSDPTKARITAVSFGGSSGLNVELSVDGADDSDDYIGGFLQNFSPAAIQEFAVRTAEENADTGRTTAGSVVITTKRGTDQPHGEAEFYERAAGLNARFPIDNPAPNPKQPFSRQNFVAALGGPLRRHRLWAFSSFEAVRENASIAYSAASLAQFQALGSLAAAGLIPGVASIDAPSSVPVPFRDAMASLRLDWAQSDRSQWFLRLSSDGYTTHNDLVQQAALPSTGATSRSSYVNAVLDENHSFNSHWLSHFLLAASLLRHSETRNGDLGFALAFPFSATASTISGFETFGDNQFVTPITAFPVLRDQEKYQLRYDLSRQASSHVLRFGLDFIHEPVLSGALAANAENLTVFPMNPSDYLAAPRQFAADLVCAPDATPGTTCLDTPAGNGAFSQNVQRLGLYVQDEWEATPRLRINYGLRWDTTFGLFQASGRSQAGNPALLTLRALNIPLAGVPHDYRKAFAPRLGIAFSPDGREQTVIRAGAGLFFSDSAQNGWVQALQAVNEPPAPCFKPGDAGCLPGGAQGAVIDPNYETPYAIHITAGVEHAFTPNWSLGADWTHEEGNHSYRRYEYQAGYTLFSPLFPQDRADQQANVPNVSVFRGDNRSSYDALSVHLQGHWGHRSQWIFNYTLARANTWGCVLGELFDYVNGVCNPLHAFAPGDYGPSGEDVRHRAVLAGSYLAPGGLRLSLLGQAESARPFTLTTPVDVNGLGDPTDDRAVVNGVQTTLDELRGTPFVQFDLRVSRPIRRERWTLTPLIEFFNLFNRSNPGANYVTSLAALPIPVNSLSNATAFCLNAACTQTQPITSLRQLRAPAGALGDFFGPGTTVGIPFAAQLGVRLEF